MSSDPISSVADAVTETAKLIGQMSAMQHPLLYMFRIHRLTNHIVKWCKQDGKIVPEDIVGAYCFDLATSEQLFILHVVKEKLGLS